MLPLSWNVSDAHAQSCIFEIEDLKGVSRFSSLGEGIFRDAFDLKNV